MKKLLLVLFCLWISVPAFSADFVSPIGFEATDANRAAVIAYIKQDVKQACAKIGMDSESTLRLMENENLKAFKELLQAEDKDTLVRIIKQYCGIGMCNYATILMMYKEEIKAKGTSLNW